jgi:hypothetical protein
VAVVAYHSVSKETGGSEDFCFLVFLFRYRFIGKTTRKGDNEMVASTSYQIKYKINILTCKKHSKVNKGFQRNLVVGYGS